MVVAENLHKRGKEHGSHVWNLNLTGGDEIFGSHDLNNPGRIPNGCMVGVQSTLEMLYPHSGQSVGVIVTDIQVGLEVDTQVREQYDQKSEIPVSHDGWAIEVNSTFYVDGKIWPHRNK